MRVLGAILSLLIFATGAFAAPPDFVKLPNNVNYHATMGDASVVLGGQLPNDKFVPSVKATKWGEAYVELFAHKVTVGNNKEVKSNGKITLEVGNEKHRMYSLADESMEYEIEFATRPTSGTYEFRVSKSAGVTAHKQFITQEEYDAGARYTRPDVEGSYAFYYNKRNNKYKTGKVAHIYRPKLIDALGAEAWCDMDISGNILTITMPTDALDNMTYPVILDPILGYDTQGASSLAVGNGEAYYLAATTDAYGGVMSTINAYVISSTGDDIKIGIANADQSTGDPEGKTIIDQTILTTSGSTLISGAITGVLAASTKYAIGAIPASTHSFYYDLTTNNLWRQTGAYATELSSPVTTTTIWYSDRIFSLWVEYAPVSNGTTHLGEPIGSSNAIF